MSRGAGALSDAELLAIFLRTGVAGKSAVQLARELIGRFGNLRGLLKADLGDFSAAKGLGPAKYAQLQTVLEMARRHLAQSLPQRDALTDPMATRRYLAAQLRDRAHEVFACLFLDNRHPVLAFQELFRATLDGASVYPREVVKAALKHNAAAHIRLTTIRPVWRSRPTRTGALRAA